MKNLLCGSCALKASLELSERIELANARKLNVEYHCLGCKKNHSWTLPKVEAVAAAIVNTVDTVEIEKKSEIYIQTRLF